MECKLHTIRAKAKKANGVFMRAPIAVARIVLVSGAIMLAGVIVRGGVVALVKGVFSFIKLVCKNIFVLGFA
jgi:hypothetical protein